MAYLFECPGCGEEILVDSQVREAILECGCPICRTDISLVAFNA